VVPTAAPFDDAKDGLHKRSAEDWGETLIMMLAPASPTNTLSHTFFGG
jgi:hypothetical protein